MDDAASAGAIKTVAEKKTRPAMFGVTCGGVNFAVGETEQWRHTP